MNATRATLSSACAIACATLLGGCPDTMGQFDEFIDNSEPYRVAPVAGECTGPIDLSGSYVMGAAVIVDTQKPIRFTLDLAVDLEAGTISGDLQAIAVPPNNGETAAGTLVGEVYHAEAALDATDGGFTLDFGTVVVPTAANPILPTDVTATLKLSGCTSTPTDACGLVEGDITVPTPIPLAGSTWAIVERPEGADLATIAIETACPE